MKRPLPSQTREEEGSGVPEQPCTGAAWCARGGWGHKGGFLRRGQCPRPPHSSFSLATRGHCLSFQEGGMARSPWDSGWSPHHGHGVPVCCWAAGQGTTGQQRPLGSARTAGASHTFDHSGQKKQTNRFAPSSADPKAEDQKTKAEERPTLKAPPAPPPSRAGAPLLLPQRCLGTGGAPGPPQVIEDSLPFPYSTPRGRASPKSTNNSQTSAPSTQLCSRGSQQISHLRLSPNQKKRRPWGRRCDIG